VANPASGAFSGTFTLSDVRPPATKPTLGTGFFLLPDFDKTAEQRSGEIRFSEP
jgi:hypothetical protein